MTLAEAENRVALIEALTGAEQSFEICQLIDTLSQQAGGEELLQQAIFNHAQGQVRPQ